VRNTPPRYIEKMLVGRGSVIAVSNEELQQVSWSHQK